MPTITATQLNAIGDTLVSETLEQFGPRGLAPDAFGLTLLLHSNDTAGATVGTSYRGDIPFYPCSVIKIFYLIAAQDALEKGQIAYTPELDRAMHDMIKWSSNTATNYIIDLVTGTTGDTELPADQMEQWIKARGSINTYFKGLGINALNNINVSQKLMDDDRYGREKEYVQLNGNNHNRLTTNAVAAVFSRIMMNEMISPARSKIMADYLHRDRNENFVRTPGAQVINYLGEGIPIHSEIWSKAGWTGWTRDPLASYRRHDSIHVKLQNGTRFTLIVFTKGRQISTDFSLLPFIGNRTSILIKEGSKFVS